MPLNYFIYSFQFSIEFETFSISKGLNIKTMMKKSTMASSASRHYNKELVAPQYRHSSKSSSQSDRFHGRAQRPSKNDRMQAENQGIYSLTGSSRLKKPATNAQTNGPSRRASDPNMQSSMSASQTSNRHESKPPGSARRMSNAQVFQ